jgi:YVTN family beta-propeller protein
MRLVRTLVPLIALLAAGCAQPSVAHTRAKLYVSNVLASQVSVIDPDSGAVVKKIPVGLLPHNFAFTKDKRYLYVTDSGSQDVSVIDTQTDSVVKTFLTMPIPKNAYHDKIGKINQAGTCKTCHFDPRGSFPIGIGLSPNGQDLLVANFKGGALSRIDPQAMVLKETIPLTYTNETDPVNMIFNPVKDEVYVLNRKLNGKPGRLTVLDSQYHVKRDLPVIKAPFGMVVSQDGKELYIASRGTNHMQVFDTNTWKLKREFQTGNGPVGLFLAESGKLYTANFYTNRPSFVSVLDPQTGETLKQIEMAADITRVTTDPEHHFMYVCNAGANKVTVVDLQTDEVVKEIAAGSFPVDIAYKPL